MALFFPIIIGVVMLTVVSRLTKAAKDDLAGEKKVDGMTQDDLRQAAFGTTAKAKPAKASKPAKAEKAPKKYKEKNAYKTSSGKFEEDILTRSLNNTSENFDDDSIKDVADKHEYCSAPHFEETEDFNKTVMDLIVFGPNCKMSYERDFIAEGEKMLNMQKG
ncbi:MAG: hypothetical protein IJK13_02140 [Lachnospiraceae bacterium]|nr:hypothetical protein [Lachnospiraceae bacterium]MBR0434788.1 hypothetical protein [Lachnospiraceae bacterium]